MTLQSIVDSIRSKQIEQTPILIGVEGYGGSGKTTFAEKLAEALGDTCVIHFDDFLIKEKRSDADKSAFDRRRLEDQVLRPAKNGEAVSYQRLLWSENRMSEPLIVPKNRYLIIEGVSCYHPSVVEYYDFKIWVDTPMHEAKARGIKRSRDAGNNQDDLWEVWAKTDLAYQSKYHSETIADFVFKNTGVDPI